MDRGENRDWAKMRENFVADAALPFTLRQLRAQMLHPATLTVVAGLTIILTLAGPFGTGEVFAPLPHALYWLGMISVTYLAGTVAGGLTHQAIGHRLPRSGRIALAAMVNALVIGPLVLLVNWALFDDFPEPALPFLATAGALAAVITVILEVLSRQAPRNADTAPPAIFDRLPLDKRGTLLALSVEDHYVRVRTEMGEELILMRLGDAIRETTPVAGLRVHRSHWVALAAIAAARRMGDRAILTLTDGSEVPASRANLPALREAGILPR